MRVVRTFRRERHELFEYVLRRHAMVRKEMFAFRLDLSILTAWGLLMGGSELAVLWYGGQLLITHRATLGDIVAAQWDTSCSSILC